MDWEDGSVDKKNHCLSISSNPSHLSLYMKKLAMAILASKASIGKRTGRSPEFHGFSVQLKEKKGWALGLVRNSVSRQESDKERYPIFSSASACAYMYLYCPLTYMCTYTYNTHKIIKIHPRYSDYLYSYMRH